MGVIAVAIVAKTRLFATDKIGKVWGQAERATSKLVKDRPITIMLTAKDSLCQAFP